MIFYFGITPGPQKRAAIKMTKYQVDLLYSFFYLKFNDFKEVRPGVFRQHATALDKDETFYSALKRRGDDPPKVFRSRRKKK